VLTLSAGSPPVPAFVSAQAVSPAAPASLATAS
jgi:hypothetical protein